MGNNKLLENKNDKGELCDIFSVYLEDVFGQKNIIFEVVKKKKDIRFNDKFIHIINDTMQKL